MNGKYNAEEFVMLLQQLDTTMVIGVAKILKVSFFKEEQTEETPHTEGSTDGCGGDRKIRDGEDVIFDMMNKFARMPRKSRRELLRTMRAAIPSKEDTKNGSTT